MQKDSKLAEKGTIKTNGWKLKPDQISSEAYFLSLRIINHWKKALTDMLDSPSQSPQVHTRFLSRAALARFN